MLYCRKALFKISNSIYLDHKLSITFGLILLTKQLSVHVHST